MKGTVRVAPRILGPRGEPGGSVRPADETDEAAEVTAGVDADVASDVDDDEDAGNDAEYSLLPMARTTRIAARKAPTGGTLPTPAEADARMDELIKAMSAGTTCYGRRGIVRSMELLTSVWVAGLDGAAAADVSMGGLHGPRDIGGRAAEEGEPDARPPPPPEAVQRTLDECRREADSTERVRGRRRRWGGWIARVRAIGDAAQPRRGVWREFALDGLVADGDTFKCRCGNRSPRRYATRHVCWSCMWNKDDRKKKKKDLKKNKIADRATKGSSRVPRGDVPAGEGIKSIGTDKDGREWQTKWLVF